MPTLGEELRRLREEKGHTIREVSDATHIGSRFLQAIESDNYSILPGGIFNRGFVRSYARFVGLDEDQALQLYGQQLEAHGGEAPRTLAPSLEGIEEEASSPWGSIALIALILLVLSAGFFVAYKWFKGDGLVSSAIPSPTATLGASPVSDASAVPTTPPTDSASATPATSDSPALTPTPDAAASPAPPLTGNLQVKIQVTGTDPCWLKVTTDANPSAMGTLNPGDVREFAATDKMILSLGNALTVTATLNGRPMKLPIKGVRANVVLTKDNYQQFLQ